MSTYRFGSPSGAVQRQEVERLEREIQKLAEVFLIVPHFHESEGTLNLIRLSVCPSVCHKNFNLSHNFWTIKDRAFIFHICIPYEETCPFIQQILTLWPWPWPLTYILVSENLTYVITFEPLEVAVYYFICTFLVKSPFRSYQNCWPHDLWLTYLKTLTFAITFKPLVVELSYFTCTFLVIKAFLFISKVLTFPPWPSPLTYMSENFLP